MSDPIKKITLKDGAVRYRFVVDIGREPKTGKRKQLTKTFDTKKEARAEYARIRHQTDEGTFVSPDKITVATWLDTWLKSATIHVEKATARNYADAIRPAHERLGDKRLQLLTEEDVDDLVEWMLASGRKRGGKPGTGLSARSVQLTLGRLRSALTVAVRRKLVVRNVAQYTEIPREARKQARAAKAQRKPWDAEEVKTFLAHLADHRLEAGMLLTLIGLGPAEVCGLKWDEHVDLDAKSPTIKAGENTRTLVWGENGGEVEEKGGKTENRPRKLPLPSPVAEALRRAKARQARERLAAGEAYGNSGYVLVDELGRSCRTDWLRRRAYELMEGAGVRRVRLYDARHACLTYLRMAGVPGPIVSAWAGHGDLTIADRVYVHPDVAHPETAAKHLGALLS
ncbi:Arm DNA-binding domain-containing protein [Amycolatopsis sp. lyj-84]|uniref:Arm DNA-binding domain-containing protein n=1 Tax=Amycolatopsis sp. lyj-84 TaxID=2789284 RepID=UPI00397B5923